MVINEIVTQSITDCGENFRTKMLVRHNKIRELPMMMFTIPTIKDSDSKLITFPIFSAHIPSASAAFLHKLVTNGAENFFISRNKMDSVLDIINKICYNNHCEGR